ncbi:acetyltransferase [Aliivibrio fischeri]|uniref:lipase family alpha/beta hydrolase n=1 Tax=Aliivibrio fischeri TaxID=668 RepID=UPI0012D9FEFB|nr:acetyltransferase [Aliivibrio fischeri]MUK61899.1 acetyltransferase [Aliivibrio fischeri]MUK69336.1 acetyltransferase [Aliivibrio fischeri]MUK75099.1 acetyltransferase [Aliivibrio fischeri]MUL21830.1 acetyltransferase [Aliivibrio fischeri]MUL25955.1 acetyltransferase [Aliivibrio fischeri]
MAHIVVLHGLYMHGLVMKPLASRLRRKGHSIQVISYNSVRINEALLFKRIRNCLSETEKNVIVGHSLGGILAVHFVNSHNDKNTPVDSIVTIGSPLQGSSIAKEIQSRKLGFILGNSKEQGLVDVNQLTVDCPIGSIAGTMSIGIRSSIIRDKVPSDGTVTVEETLLPELKDHLCLNYSHTSLIYAKQTVEQIDHFIHNHEFKRVIEERESVEC